MDLTGEYEDRYFVTTRGDTRMYLTIGRNRHTAKLSRENRFLIDDMLSKNKMAYQLTKPLKVGNVYNGDGVYTFILQEVVTTDDDNQDLMIADYYKHFPRGSTVDAEDSEDEESTDDSGGTADGNIKDSTEVWL